MSFFGLNLAGSALAAYQASQNVTSNDIANVNTPGASQQQSILTEAPPITGTIGYPAHTMPGTIGDGVLLQLVQRVHDDSYDTLFRNATSSQYFYQVQQSQLNAAQGLLNEPSGGINDAYTAFMQSVQALQANPADVSTRSGIVNSARSLVATISTTGNGLQSQEAQVQGQTTSLITTVNGILDQIAQLNGQIRASTAAGDNPNTYKDQRDNLIDQLSQYLSVQTSLQPNGSALVTVGGLALVNDTVAYHLASPVVGTNADGTPALKIGFANDPNPLNPSQIPLGQGQLAGLVDLYNNKLAVYLTQLDGFTNALATEVDRVTESGYDQNGVTGQALLQPVVSTKAISSTNIQVGITDPTQIVAALATTAAGTLTNPVNSSNQSVDPSASIWDPANPVVNTTFQNPATAPIVGNLTVSVDGVNQTFTYSTTPGAGKQIDASSIDSFIASFNALQAGVTASYDTTGQQVVFTRDPNNESLGLRSNPTYVPSASFSVHDSNNPGAAGSAAVNGLAGSILGVLGVAGLDGIANSQLTVSATAGSNTITVANPTGFAPLQKIDIDAGNGQWETATITAVNGNVLTLAAPLANTHASNAEVYLEAGNAAVVQNATNAFGQTDNSAAIALTKMTQTAVGVPGIDTQVGVFQPGPNVAAGVFTAPVGQSSVTVTEAALALQQFGQINVGQQLTIVGQVTVPPPPYVMLNAVVTAVNRNGGGPSGTVTLQVTNTTGAAVSFGPGQTNYTSLIATPQQTLGQFYAGVIAQVGIDGQTATTGTKTQTSVANSINQVRQSIDGINLDEETQNLIKYQTAYQAAAKTVTMLDTMLQSVLGMIQ
jgi:flagellar hook-associated protein 1 FlgK